MGYVQGVGMSMGWALVSNHLLLTPSGGNRTYGQQAGGIHPTGMHSC